MVRAEPADGSEQIGGDEYNENSDGRPEDTELRRLGAHNKISGNGTRGKSFSGQYPVAHAGASDVSQGWVCETLEDPLDVVPENDNAKRTEEEE